MEFLFVVFFISAWSSALKGKAIFDFAIAAAWLHYYVITFIYTMIHLLKLITKALI